MKKSIALFIFVLFVGCFSLAAEESLYRSFVSLDTLYISDDNGQNWQALDILPQINSSAYLVASARHPSNPNRILVASSFEGLYESLDKGKTWKFISESKVFKDLFQGAGFYDEVSALSYLDSSTNDFAFRINYKDGIYMYDSRNKKVKKINPEDPQYSLLPETFKKNNFSKDAPDWQPYIPVANTLSPSTIDLSQPGISQEDLAYASQDENWKKRRELAQDKRGIYLNVTQARGKNLDKNLALVKTYGMNSIVVDFKDDYGRLTYPSSLDIVQKTKAANSFIDPEEIIKKAHEAGVYVIARVVVFKDRQLYRYNNNQYALWDKRRKAPWGVFRTETIPATETEEEKTTTTQTEFWVDPYSDFVHNYNLQICKEIQSLGVDEIQLDYIRFPSDGNTRDILSRFHVDSEGKTLATETMKDRVSALSSFLRLIRRNISLPLGTDVFGFNAWARMSYLGQDIQAFSFFVDVISPMNYPSHYARDFLPGLSYFERASAIYKTGTDRALKITGNRVIIRPYIQAFLIGGELKFTDPQMYDYLNRQIRASEEGKASGYTLWNNLGNYYMIDPKTFPKSNSLKE